MMMGKGAQTKFATLAARELSTVQVAHLRRHFELAERSLLAEKAVQLVNGQLEQVERRTKTPRVKPGEIAIEYQGQVLTLPILSFPWVERLHEDMTLPEVRRQHEHEQYTLLRGVNPDVTYGELWQVLGLSDSNRKRSPKDYDYLPEEPFAESEWPVMARTLSDNAFVPEEVMISVKETLVNEYGCRPGQAEAMITFIAAMRAWCCPLLSELTPGQMVWLAHGTKKSRKTDPKLFVPVVLTLLTLDEQSLNVQHSGEYKAMKIKQVERMTTEAWRQDGVLTNTDVEWITGISSSTIRGLLEAYQERFGIILPTAGTVLDMGRTLTHKKIVVELSLSGLTTQEIARRIYHTPEAVDNYLKTFDRLLILRYYGLPIGAMMRVLGHGRALLNEHLELIDKHFKTQQDLHDYLHNRGLSLENIG